MLEINQYYDKIEQEIKNLASKNDAHKSAFYNSNRTSLATNIYEYTKKYLDKYSSTLTPNDKGKIFSRYIKLWKQGNCKLHIKDTEYADLYKKSRFGPTMKYYKERMPMMAGFNLDKANIPVGITSANFLSVNFSGANFSERNFSNSHFENCDLSGIIANNTSFSLVQFYYTSLLDADLSSTTLNQSIIAGCDIRGTLFNGEHQRIKKLFQMNSISNNNTLFDSYNKMISNHSPRYDKRLQNVDKKEVLEYWKQKYIESEQMPQSFLQFFSELFVTNNQMEVLEETSEEMHKRNLSSHTAIGIAMEKEYRGEVKLNNTVARLPTKTSKQEILELLDDASQSAGSNQL